MFPFMNIEDQKTTEDMLAVVLFIIMNVVLVWYHINRITVAIEQHTMMPPHNKNNRRGRKY